MQDPRGVESDVDFLSFTNGVLRVPEPGAAGLLGFGALLATFVKRTSVRRG